ncbi:putative zinc transport system zinc-binding lipoprotein AdcA precursor [Bhargavaea cecembensis DSE10]|uniref:Putative zinc transport system zinc-binding lipoprotein AdcA n=1 Tax=Bhargavaea cecembensis DSE10 TaxID=1235279 RepID=M7P555_9BACL|nr:zinc ABC transporter substrate-binding protein [Bhargavaea cecembensis]EMR05659.1 putative zinc transport system zinc-binding lipoprotein AdcA precursor [Bhargavaea cecembensis DSE10]
MKRLMLILSASLLVLAGCGGNDPSDEGQESENATEQKVTVKTTVYPLAYFTERIGGDSVSVSSVYPPGADSHTFEPTQKDMISLAESDLFIHTGLGLEGFVNKAEQTLSGEDVRLIAAAAHISDDQLLHGHGHEEEHGHDEEAGHEGHDHSGADPHVWLSPVLADRLALAVKEALSEELPEKEAEFAQRYEELSAELKELDGEFRSMADRAQSKTFFVSHAAFGYIAEEYGLEQVSIAGLNPQSEPSQKELARIVDLAREKEATTIFFEQNITSKLTQVIVNEIGAESGTLHNLSVLSEEDIENSEDYFSLMRKNIERLGNALNP